MTRVLVTGGTGTLGREITQQLLVQGYTVRIMSRGGQNTQTSSRLEWARAELANGAGISTAVADVDVLIHAASSLRHPSRVDVAGTHNLVEAARRAGVQHCVYVSIVGIDGIPLPYYRHKLAAEQLVRTAGVPWTIVRATQFHTLIDALIRFVNRGPLLVLPVDWRSQPIEPGEVATRLVQLVVQGPQQRIINIGGPEVLTLGEMTRVWLRQSGLQRRIAHLPLPGKISQGYRSGFNTCPDDRYGTISWADWIERTTAPAFPARSAYER